MREIKSKFRAPCDNIDTKLNVAHGYETVVHVDVGTYYRQRNEGSDTGKEAG